MGGLAVVSECVMNSCWSIRFLSEVHQIFEQVGEYLNTGIQLPDRCVQTRLTRLEGDKPPQRKKPEAS